MTINEQDLDQMMLALRKAPEKLLEPDTVSGYSDERLRMILAVATVHIARNHTIETEGGRLRCDGYVAEAYNRVLDDRDSYLAELQAGSDKRLPAIKHPTAVATGLTLAAAGIALLGAGIVWLTDGPKWAFAATFVVTFEVWTAAHWLKGKLS